MKLSKLLNFIDDFMILYQKDIMKNYKRGDNDVHLKFYSHSFSLNRIMVFS